jgi:hypothetical protein
MNQNRTALTMGIVLIILGVLFLVGQSLDFFQFGDLWPMIIVGIGGAFFLGMILGGKSTGGLAIPGSIISMVGLILLFQEITGWWETWSYAWALIIVAVGIGQVIYSYWSDIPSLRKSGWETAKVGLILFIIFGAIMEFIFSITGVATRGSLVFWSALLLVIGLVQLGVRVFRLLFRRDNLGKDDRDLFGPFFLIGIGLTALLYSLGWVTSEDLWTLVSLWPLLLVFAGLQLIFGRRFAWMSALLGVALLAVVVTVLFAGQSLGLQPFSFWNLPANISTSWRVTETVDGSGQVTQEERQVSGFDRVSLEPLGILEITQGEEESLVIEAEDNLIPYLTSDVSGSTLNLAVQRGIGLNPTKPIRYILTVKDLSEVQLSGAGEMNLPALETINLTLGASGAGTFKIDELTADELRVEISGTGTVTVGGVVDRLDINISGAGSFNGADLQANQVEVDISGLGKATVWVVDELDVEISGAGSVSYYGSPSSVTKNTSGAGIIEDIGDK